MADYIIYNIARVARGIDAVGMQFGLCAVGCNENPICLGRTTISYKYHCILRIPLLSSPKWEETGGGLVKCELFLTVQVLLQEPQQVLQ